MNSSLLVGIANHLWQSTLFAALAGCLTLILRRNSARVRCTIWLAASLKFLLPFSVLMYLGSRIPWPFGTSQVPLPGLMAMGGQRTSLVTKIGGVRATDLARTSQTLSHGGVILTVLELLWAIGALAVAVRWFSRWQVMRRSLRESTPSSLPFVVPVRSSPSQFEPAVVGVPQPVLLLPRGMEQRLSPQALDAVLAHEQCHVASRDNLAASLHMLVETIFWFHPLVWWLGSRIIQERELACDEKVLAQGHPSQSYAEGILKVCEFYLQSPIASASGISGANLSHRIEAIMKNRVVEQLSNLRKSALTLAAGATIALPLAVGILASPHSAAAAATAAEDVLALRHVSIRLAPQDTEQGPALYNSLGMMSPDTKKVQVFYPTLRDLVAAAYGVDSSQVIGKDLSKEPKYQITADNPWPETPTDSGEVRAARYIKMSAEVQGFQRQLLAAQFGLVVKRERLHVPGYVLTVGPGGSKLTEDSSAPSWKQGVGYARNEIFSTATPVVYIVHALQSMLREPVVDQTGLGGIYDYKLTWTAPPPGEFPDPTMMKSALEEQLGLHLEAQKVTVDVINVLSIKSPDEIVTAK